MLWRLIVMEENKNVTRQAPAHSRKAAPKRSGNDAWTSTKKIMHYVWMFRGIIISIPVLVLALGQAFRNAARLPEKVGMDLQATGEFAVTIGRPTAVVLPLLITMGCIVLTCFTKRPLFPWLISIFSLVLPILIWVINMYPA